MKKVDTDPVAVTKFAWGDDLPDWVLGLAQRCSETSQNSVAKAMGRSASLISSVLRNKYGGNMATVEDLYRGVFEAKVVQCPALGELPINQCYDWRAKGRKLISRNPRAVMMHRACARCPINGADK